MLNQAASVEYQPLGVIGVIGPWNYPVFTPMGSIGYALAAGNAVVFKPSELTTGVGQWLVQSFTEVLSEVFGETEPVLQLVTGLGATGAELARSGVNKLAFTGSAATARKVLAAAAETLTPGARRVRREGRAARRRRRGPGRGGGRGGLGRDVQRRADLRRRRAGVRRGVGVPRRSSRSSGERVSQLRPGDDASAAYGPMTLPGQVDVVERHLADAVARGGRAVFGGLDSVRAPFVSPVVLVDVPEESAAVREETFGPVVTVTPVPSLADAVRLANASPYALGSAVFTKRRRAGLRAARALRSGMTSVNSVISFAAVPALPFGGSGESGFGRIHGADGLREFSRAKSITRQRMKPVVRTTTFSRTSTDMDRIVKLVTVLHGRLYQPKRGDGARAARPASPGGQRGRRLRGRRVERDQRGAAGDEVGGALGDRDHRGVGVAARQRRHDRGVHDAQPGHAADAEQRVDHAVVAARRLRHVAAHRAGADRVVAADHAAPDEVAHLVVGVRPRRPATSSAAQIFDSGAAVP